jgi:hypothetical protein
VDVVHHRYRYVQDASPRNAEVFLVFFGAEGQLDLFAGLHLGIEGAVRPDERYDA